MNFYLLSSILLIGATNGQWPPLPPIGPFPPIGPPFPNCGTNEYMNNCHNSCSEKKCPAPIIAPPSICPTICNRGCSCQNGYVRNAQGRCVREYDCPPIAPPTLPPPVCPSNEYMNTCHNPCTEKKCPVWNPTPIACPAVCSRACSCQNGFVRNLQGRCVRDYDCPRVVPPTTIRPTPPPPTCNSMNCGFGQRCEIQNGRPVCVPVFGDIICMFFPCPSGTRCQAVNFLPRCVAEPTTPPPTTRPTPPTTRPSTCANLMCATYRGGCGMVYPTWCPPGCNPQPQCLEVNNCNTKRCPHNQECVLVQVNCVRAPCNPVAECRPRRNTWPFGREGDEPSEECPENEIFSNCKTNCSEKKCNEDMQFKECSENCDGTGCFCRDGYLRDEDEKCVEPKECGILRIEP